MATWERERRVTMREVTDGTGRKGARTRGGGIGSLRFENIGATERRGEIQCGWSRAEGRDDTEASRSGYNTKADDAVLLGGQMLLSVTVEARTTFSDNSRGLLRWGKHHNKV